MMSTKQILRRCLPVFKRSFSTRTYGDFCTYRRHAIASYKIYHRLLRLQETAVSGTYASLSLQTANTECHRRLSYSCGCRTSQSSNVVDFSDLKKYTTKHEVKQTQEVEADPELVSLMQELEEDDSRKLNSETVSEEDLKHTRIAADTSQSERDLDDVGVNKSDTEFEYDYQVAEDIEEYDYIDGKSHMEQQIQSEKVLPISLKRGQNGVFDLHELVTLLEHLGAENIVTVPVPPEANFCDDMVVVSVKSRRHLQAINEEMLWVHKRKKAKRDPSLVIEGKDKADWCAMDLGNIVLHIFFGELREFYDIESLWLLGPDHDPKCQEQTADPYILSAEDLFWLETGQVKGKSTDQVGSPTVTDQDGNQTVTDRDDSQTVTDQDGNQTVTDQDGNQTVTDRNDSQTVTDRDDSQTVTDHDGSLKSVSGKQLNLTSAEESVSKKTDRSDKMR